MDHALDLTPDVTVPALAPKPPKQRGRWRRRLLVVLAIFSLLAIVVPLGLRMWLSSEAGRDTVARAIERFASDGIRGSLTIGGIDRISTDGVIGHDIRFFDEDGHLVIEARQADVAIDWAELLRGHVVSPHGHASGGRVVIESMPSGQLRIDRAFEPPNPGPAGQPVGDDVVRFEALVTSGVDVRIAVRDAPGVTITGLSAILLFRAPDHGSAHLRADRIRGGLTIAAPIPVGMDVRGGTLTLIGDSRRRADMRLPTIIGGQRVQMNVRVLADAQERMRVQVHLRPEEVGGLFTAAPLLLQALAAGALSDMVDTTVDMP